MRNNKSALLAALAMSALSAGYSVTPGASSPLPQVSETNVNTKQTTADRGQNAPSDTKSDRLGTWYRRGTKAPVGKRYRASVKQHQRNATKLRSRARNRAKMR
jgi:hypothetical protein